VKRALDAFWYIWDVMDRLNLSLIAAGVGFFAMLSLFPALSAILLLWSWFADPSQINTLLDLADEVVPPEVHSVISNQVAGIINAGSSGKIGTATVISLLVALWSARAGVSALVRGLNAAYDIGHRQNIWRRYMADIGVTLTLCALTFVAIARRVVAPIVISVLPLGPWGHGRGRDRALDRGHWRGHGDVGDRLPLRPQPPRPAAHMDHPGCHRRHRAGGWSSRCPSASTCATSPITTRVYGSLGAGGGAADVVLPVGLCRADGGLPQRRHRGGGRAAAQRELQVQQAREAQARVG
jgi:hypothetical protein